LLAQQQDALLLAAHRGGLQLSPARAPPRALTDAAAAGRLARHAAQRRVANAQELAVRAAGETL
jgi:hypothetical protein